VSNKTRMAIRYAWVRTRSKNVLWIRNWRVYSEPTK